MRNLYLSLFSSSRRALSGSWRGASTAKSDVFSNETSSPTTTTTSDEDASFDLTANIPDAEEAQEREEKFREYVERKRDVSRFSKLTAAVKYRQNVPKYSDPEAKYLKGPNYFRHVLAKHGKNSGIELGVAWPTKDELRDLVKEDTEYELSLEQKINIFIERKMKEVQSIEKMEKDTDEALKKMPKQISTFFERSARKEQAEKEKAAKRQEILDQAREYYGFEVDLRDHRIQEMVTKLQEEKKAAEKQKKREEEKKKAQTNALQQKLKDTEKLMESSGEPNVAGQPKKAEEKPKQKKEKKQPKSPKPAEEAKPATEDPNTTKQP